MCSAIDFSLYMSHNLFACKSGRLHGAGELMTKFDMCQLFKKHAAELHFYMCFSYMCCLLFGKALQTYFRDLLFRTQFIYECESIKLHPLPCLIFVV